VRPAVTPGTLGSSKRAWRACDCCCGAGGACAWGARRRSLQAWASALSHASIASQHANAGLQQHTARPAPNPSPDPGPSASDRTGPPPQQIIIPEFHRFYWLGLFVNASANDQWAWLDPHVPGPSGYYAKWGTTSDGQGRPLSPPGLCAGGNWCVPAPRQRPLLQGRPHLGPAACRCMLRARSPGCPGLWWPWGSTGSRCWPPGPLQGSRACVR
jgi:hypothetical protein